MLQRLADDPPPSSPELTALLTLLSDTVPTLFFRPVIACARSNQDANVVAQLRIIGGVARQLPSFWIKNDEMIAVALMTAPNTSTIGHDIWAKPRLGQCVIMLELINHIKALTRSKKDPEGVRFILREILVMTFLLPLDRRELSR